MTSVAAAVEALVGALRGRRVAVLTGAGCSTESGIPDYRGPETRARARNPIEYRAFVNDPAARRRYWSRSLVGWPRIRVAEPNAAHRALAELEAAGVLAGLVTQNVDRLHTRAGSAAPVELHGALAEVRCLACRAVVARDALQARLLADNPTLGEARASEVAPDGDATLEVDLDAFVVPACESCGGVLKPDVVFFGEAVPVERVRRSEAIVDQAEAMLVVGSSLAVYSGLRFVRRAAARGLPCVLLNLGPPERGAECFSLHVDAPAGEVLALTARVLPGELAVGG
ncbi:MAG: NAD-dependent protein deacetylase [Myxococcota bacterium]